MRPDGTFASAGLGFASATFENTAGQYDGGFSSGSRTDKTAGKYEFRDGV